MKANWDRHDSITKYLFARESDLEGDFKGKADQVQNELFQKFQVLEREGIASSHGLDHFLQVAMAWITTYLGKQIGQPSVRATVSRYLKDLEAVLVKPCLVGPGSCRAPQPTISLKKERVGFSGRIGHTGVSMRSGKILYCRPYEELVHGASVSASPLRCGQYITIDPLAKKEADSLNGLRTKRIAIGPHLPVRIQARALNSTFPLTPMTLVMLMGKNSQS
jgi:hypothetical protein